MNLNTRTLIDVIFSRLVWITGFLVISILLGILSMLIFNGFKFFLSIESLSFWKGVFWSPDEHYSIFPLLMGTMFVTLLSMAIAIPVGIFTAAYISEFAPNWFRNLSKPMIEILASIPSVVIGFIGIVVIGPFLSTFFQVSNGLNALNGSILLAVMAMPTIISISEDAIHAVPKSHKEASFAMGANRWQTLFRVTLPTASPGLIAASMLGMGRALGETMTVLMATGNVPMPPTGVLDSIRTITATIAIEMGEVPYHSTHYYALFAIALVLFSITLLVNLTGEYFANRFRKFQ
ncbi:MAG: phosphate ABC transporter permease subunit PstC [Cytophagales bacterium]